MIFDYKMAVSMVRGDNLSTDDLNKFASDAKYVYESYIHSLGVIAECGKEILLKDSEIQMLKDMVLQLEENEREFCAAYRYAPEDTQ